MTTTYPVSLREYDRLKRENDLIERNMNQEPITISQTKTAESFVASFYLLSAAINVTAREKGWWDKERNNGECIALMHSELSEALENLRDKCKPDNHIPDFKGVEAEFADVIIRIMDLSYERSWRVAEAIIAKMEYNKNRPRLHGGRNF